MSEFEQDLANVMGSFIETELDCVYKQNEEIEQLKKEKQQLKQALLDIKEYIETNSYFKNNIVKTMVLGDYSKDILDIVNKVLGSDSK